MSDQIVTPVGRVLWSDLTQPDDYGKYTLKVGFDKDADLSTIEEAIQAEVDKKFNGKVTAKHRMPIIDGNTEVDDNGNVYESSKDMRIIRFKTKHKPMVCGPGGHDDVRAVEDIYSGCYVRVISKFYAYNNVSKGVSSQLESLQLYKHGERLGGSSGKKVDVATAFAEVEDADTSWP